MKKKFIKLDKINFPIARSGFRYKVSKKRFIIACGCAVASFIVPDLGIGLVVGLCLLSPIGFKKSLFNKKESVKEWVTSKYYKMRLRL